MNDFNQRPEGFREITEETFKGLFFQHTLKHYEYRQIKYDPENCMQGLFRCRFYVFTAAEDFGFKGLGLALQGDWKAKKLKFATFGEPNDLQKFYWQFAGQFKGDNSWPFRRLIKPL